MTAVLRTDAYIRRVNLPRVLDMTMRPTTKCVVTKCCFILLFGVVIAVIAESVSAEDQLNVRVRRAVDHLTFLKIQQQMLLLSKLERSRRRLAIECSRPMRRRCKSMMARCHARMLTKRSLDFQEGGVDLTDAPPAERFQGDMKTIHTVTKRAVRRRIRYRYRLNCQICRQKCYSTG